LQNRTQPAVLELIQFQYPTGEYLRKPDRWFDFGLFSIALRVKNLEDEYANFIANGYKCSSPPCRYRAGWVNVEIAENIVWGPGGVAVPLIQRLTHPVPMEGRFGDFTDSAQIVDDMEDAENFYSGICGLPKRFDKILPAGLVNEILAIPSETGIRMAFFGEPGLPFVECIQYLGNRIPGIKKKIQLPQYQRPGYGLFMITLEMTSPGELEAVRENVFAAGYPVIGGPVRVKDGIYGDAVSMIVSGPAGVRVRFFMRTDL
jgi:hypothetical protein